jgi:hypothetical protein
MTFGHVRQETSTFQSNPLLSVFVRVPSLHFTQTQHNAADSTTDTKAEPACALRSAQQPLPDVFGRPSGGTAAQ